MGLTFEIKFTRTLDLDLVIKFSLISVESLSGVISVEHDLISTNSKLRQNQIVHSHLKDDGFALRSEHDFGQIASIN